MLVGYGYDFRGVILEKCDYYCLWSNNLSTQKIVVKILVLYGDFVGEIPEMFLSFWSCNFFLFW